VDAGIHPFRKSLATLRVGDAFASDLREVTLADIEQFAEFTGDTFYAHMDEEAAAANPFFPGRVAHGYLLLSFAAGLFVDPAPGPVLANYGLENLRFVTPVSPGDRVRVTLTAKQISPRESEDYGEVRWDAVIRNQEDEIVATYDVLTLVAKSTVGDEGEAGAAPGQPTNGLSAFAYALYPEALGWNASVFGVAGVKSLIHGAALPMPCPENACVTSTYVAPAAVAPAWMAALSTGMAWFSCAAASPYADGSRNRSG
jgi:acyl dehydratase